MRRLPYCDNIYNSPKKDIFFLSRIFPSSVFYLNFLGIVWTAGWQAKRGVFDDEMWVNKSFAVFDQLENVGVRIQVSGIENVSRAEKPVVFIGNHMSMMETLLLPLMIQPIKPVTFVIKESLLTYPVFKHVMISRDPIAVTRTNPRQDLKTVLSEGVDRLVEKKRSVIVFPQTTRSAEFESGQMSSIGIKLAKKADVEVVPVAIKTDCWQNGQLLKDFGKLDRSKTAYFAFGEPFPVIGKGEVEQDRVAAFISAKLQKWR